MPFSNNTLHDVIDMRTNDVLNLLHDQYPALADTDPGQTKACLSSLAFVVSVLLARVDLRINTKTADYVQSQFVDQINRERPAIVAAARDEAVHTFSAPAQQQ